MRGGGVTGNKRWTVHDDLVIDHVAGTVELAGVPVNLTQTEFRILVTLSDAAGQVVTREQLMMEVWGHTWFARRDHVSAHIHRLRTQLHDSTPTPRFIHTVRGVGYRFATPETSPPHALAVTALMRLDIDTAQTFDFYTLTDPGNLMLWVSSSVFDALGREPEHYLGQPLGDYAVHHRDGIYHWTHTRGGAVPYRCADGEARAGSLTKWVRAEDGSVDSTAP